MCGSVLRIVGRVNLGERISRNDVDTPQGELAGPTVAPARVSARRSFDFRQFSATRG